MVERVAAGDGGGYLRRGEMEEKQDTKNLLNRFACAFGVVAGSLELCVTAAGMHGLTIFSNLAR